MPDWENISAADLMLPRDESPQPEAGEGGSNVNKSGGVLALARAIG